MASSLVSIIMLSHNGGRFVEESVRSIQAQTYTNWELLFFDVNSKDDTGGHDDVVYGAGCAYPCVEDAIWEWYDYGDGCSLERGKGTLDGVSEVW